MSHGFEHVHATRRLQGCDVHPTEGPPAETLEVDALLLRDRADELPQHGAVIGGLAIDLKNIVVRTCTRRLGRAEYRSQYAQPQAAVRLLRFGFADVPAEVRL